MSVSSLAIQSFRSFAGGQFSFWTTLESVESVVDFKLGDFDEFWGPNLERTGPYGAAAGDLSL